MKFRSGTEGAVSSWQLAAGGKDGAKVEVGIGFKPISRVGSERLIRSAIQYEIPIWNGGGGVELAVGCRRKRWRQGGGGDWFQADQPRGFGTIDPLGDSICN